MQSAVLAAVSAPNTVSSVLLNYAVGREQVIGDQVIGKKIDNWSLTIGNWPLKTVKDNSRKEKQSLIVNS